MTPIKEDSMRLRQAAFCIETVAHLNHLERELLPLADALREIAERMQPSTRYPYQLPSDFGCLPTDFQAEVALGGREIPLADPEWIQFKETGK